MSAQPPTGYTYCSFHGTLESDCVKIHLCAVLAKMKIITGLHLALKVFRITDNLSKALQSTKLTATEGKDMAMNTVKVLEDLRTGGSAFVENAIIDAKRNGTTNLIHLLTRF